MKNIPNIIAHIEANFKSQVWDFFIDTEFGILGVECRTEDYKPMYPVEVGSWDQEHDSTFWYDHKHVDADFYVGIGNADISSSWVRYVHIVEAVLRVFFMRTLGIDPGENVIDAAVHIYITQADIRSKPPTKIIDEFLKTNFDVITRNLPSTRMMAEKIVNTRINASREVENTADKLIIMYEAQSGYGPMEFCYSNLWVRSLFSLVLYCIQRDPSLRIKIVEKRAFGFIIFKEKIIQPVDGIII